MAYRMFLGGVPVCRDQQQVAHWCFQRFNVWPATVNLKVSHAAATKQICFLGFPTLQERDQVLNQLRADPTMYGDRISAAVLKDSADYESLARGTLYLLYLKSAFCEWRLSC